MQAVGPLQAATTSVEVLPAATSPQQAISLLINTAVGAGVLSLPFAFRCAGWAGGLLILGSVAALEAYTLHILSRYAELTGTSSYGGVVHRALGPAASAALSLVLFLYLFGSGVAYLVILGDCFHPLLSHFFGAAWWTSRRAAIAGVGTTVVLPLCFPDSIAAASRISDINFGAFCAVIAAIVARSAQVVATAARPFEGVAAFSPSFLKAIPIAVFGLQCHAQVIAIFVELDDPGQGLDGPDLPQSQPQPQAGPQQGWRRRRRQRSAKLRSMTDIIIRASE